MILASPRAFAEDQKSPSEETMVSVLDSGADQTGVKNSMAAFREAIKAAANVVAPCGDGSNTKYMRARAADARRKTGYLISDTITLPNMGPRSMGGVVWIRFMPRNNETDLFDFRARYNSDMGSNGGEFAGFPFVHPGRFKGRNDIRISSGNHGYVHNTISTGAGRDCCHVEPGYSNEWIESLHIEDVTCWHAERDNFNSTVPDGMTDVLITQTTIINNTSRLPGRATVTLDSENQKNGNFKISSWGLRGRRSRYRSSPFLIPRLRGRKNILRSRCLTAPDPDGCGAFLFRSSAAYRQQHGDFSEFALRRRQSAKLACRAHQWSNLLHSGLPSVRPT